MQTNLEHPAEEALERFLLNRAGEEEVETIETHILACESCVTRLETMEFELANLKAAFAASQQEQRVEQSVPAKGSWMRWFTIPNLSWAGAACAVLLIGVSVMPAYLGHRTAVSGGPAVQADLTACSGTDISLAACRGTGSATLPGGTRLHLTLDTTDIPQGPIDVQVVDGRGAAVWQGQSEVKNERAAVDLPQIGQAGPYFLRFYAPSVSAERELLREYRFEIR